VRRALVVVVEVGLFVGLLGIPDGGLGVMWPSLRHAFHRPVGDLGILVLAGTVPYLLASAHAARAVRRLGFGTLTVAIGAVGTAAFVGCALAPVWGVVVGAFAVLGWSRGSTDAALNAHVSATEGVRRLGLLHASYGVGATAGPLLVSFVLGLGGGWQASVVTFAVIASCVTLAAVAAREGWAVTPAAAPRGTGSCTPNTAATGRGGVRDVAALLGVFAVYTGTEAATGAWAFTVLTQSRHLERGVAAVAVAGYWGALTVGRFGLAAVGHRVGRGRAVWGGSALALVGVVLFAVGGRVVGAASLPLAGLGFAPMFPVMVSLIPDRVGPERSATLIGWAVGVAAVGGPAGTALAGVVADRAGVATIAAVLVVLSALLLCGAVVTFRGDP
jgi:fucose permease